MSVREEIAMWTNLTEPRVRVSQQTIKVRKNLIFGAVLMKNRRVSKQKFAQLTGRLISGNFMQPMVS